MFFESFLWEEEKLGLISGVSFILMGVLGYAIYLQKIGLLALVFMVLAMVSAGGTAVLFQLPRIKGMRAAIGTFIGGMTIGGAVILFVIAGVLAGGALLHEVIVFSIIGAEVILAFFAVGFLLLALYPPGIDNFEHTKPEAASSPLPKAEKKESSKVEIDDDIFGRL